MIPRVLSHLASKSTHVCFVLVSVVIVAMPTYSNLWLASEYHRLFTGIKLNYTADRDMCVSTEFLRAELDNPVCKTRIRDLSITSQMSYVQIIHTKSTTNRTVATIKLNYKTRSKNRCTTFFLVRQLKERFCSVRCLLRYGSVDRTHIEC